MHFTHLSAQLNGILIYSQSCVTITATSFRIFVLPIPPTKEILHPSAITLLPQPTPPSGNRYLLFVPIDLPVLNISYKWNPIICSLLCLTYSFFFGHLIMYVCITFIIYCMCVCLDSEQIRDIHGTQ